MATKSISQLDTQATANETDLFEVAIVDANSASGYASKKESAAAIADAIVGEYQYPLRITGTTAKTIAGAINELKNLVDLLPQFAIEVVQTLPVSDISTTTIYLVPASDPEQGNYYEEYIYVNNAWELVGTTAVDLSQYYTSAQVDTLLAAKADSSSLATVATSGAYSDLSGKPTIDTALDTTSTNAVENRAVASEINSIKSDITVDGSASGDIATFVDGSANPLKELKISIVATQSGSGDPSPENERPIIGFNAVNVGDISDTEKVQYFKGLLDGTYAFIDMGNLTYEYSSTYGIFISKTAPYFDNGGIAKYQGGGISTLYTRQNVPLTNPPDMSFYVANSTTIPVLRLTNSNYTDATEFKSAMSGTYLIIELATPTTPTITPTEFNTLVSAFGLQGWLSQIAMPTEAGTVYGGTLDVKTGELIVTCKKFVFNELIYYGTYGADNAPLYYVEIPDYDTIPIKKMSLSTQSGILLANMAKKTTSSIETGMQNNEIRTQAQDPPQRFYMRFDNDPEISSEKPFEVVAELQTPIVYQLTPTEIRSLLGVNNVWADCGAITELKYTRDLNLCINDIIARIEALEGASNTRSLSVSPTLTKSLTSDSDTTEGKTEETEEETKEEAQNER